ncbi:MAG: DMT family transporter [Devosiaceae bacterium]|nr:DMT family transporter [Devosiaceae bacterium]
MTRNRAILLLLGAAFFWGMAFIAQKSAMDHMGPLTFIASRYLLGGLIILPFAFMEYKRVRPDISPRQWLLIGVLCVSFFLGSWLQQWGLMTTTVTNSGFLTGIYVLFVPLLQWLVFKTRPHAIIWYCASLAFLGLYLMSGASVAPFGIGDYLVLSSAVFWAAQVFLLGYLLPKIGLPLVVSVICFLSAGLISSIGAIGWETISVQVFQNGWVEIAYAAVFSTAIGFSLQAMGQQHMPAANAAIIVSAESLFAAAGGAILLGERLTGLGYIGIALIFFAIVAVEAVPIYVAKQRNRQPAS